MKGTKNTSDNLREIVNTLDLNEITNIVTHWDFKNGGCCGSIACYILARLEENGFIFSSYYDLLEGDEKESIKYLYEKRVVTVDGIPHENIHLFSTDNEFIGIIDIPMEAYEIGKAEGSGFQFCLSDQFKGFKREDIKLICFEPMSLDDYVRDYYHSYAKTK